MLNRGDGFRLQYFPTGHAALVVIPGTTTQAPYHLSHIKASDMKIDSHQLSLIRHYDPNASGSGHPFYFSYWQYHWIIESH